jgi:hypothetical protein
VAGDDGDDVPSGSATEGQAVKHIPHPGFPWHRSPHLWAVFSPSDREMIVGGVHYHAAVWTLKLPGPHGYIEVPSYGLAVG